MKKERKKLQTTLWSMLAVLLLLHTAANAIYVPTSLPTSTFWQGSRIYNQNGVDARVEYAVYDTQLGVVSGIVNPGSGRYIYAYQVFNVDPTLSLASITAFELLGGNPAEASGIGSQTAGAGANPIVPAVTPTISDSAFIWEFANGIFVATKYSAFMVLSTDIAPVGGNFKLSAVQDTGDEPPTPGDGGDVPEPATMALLAAGVIGFIRKRKSL